MNRLNKTESAAFLDCRFSPFLKDPFFPDYFGTCHMCEIDSIKVITSMLRDSAGLKV